MQHAEETAITAVAARTGLTKTAIEMISDMLLEEFAKRGYTLQQTRTHSDVRLPEVGRGIPSVLEGDR